LSQLSYGPIFRSEIEAGYRDARLSDHSLRLALSGVQAKCVGCSGVRQGFLARPGWGLSFLARCPDNAGDIGFAFLFLFQESVLVVARGDFRRVFAEIDNLLVLF